jgi:hypothetical protein
MIAALPVAEQTKNIPDFQHARKSRLHAHGKIGQLKPTASRQKETCGAVGRRAPLVLSRRSPTIQYGNSIGS